MSAALSASDKTISSLLSWGASPDVIGDHGDTALKMAIQSKCLTTINLLAAVTSVNLGGVLYAIARDKIEMTGELRKLVERVAQDREAAIEGLEAAAKFGFSAMIDIIKHHTKDHSVFIEHKQKIWMEGATSDNEATVSALLQLLPNPPLEAIILARVRGVPGVVRLLVPDTKVVGEEEREALKDAVFANTAQLLDLVPRDVEFTYNQNMDKLRPLLGGSLIPYDTLLKQLHLAKVHVDEPMEVCPSDCSQKPSCQRIRETLQFVKIVTQKLGDRRKVFEGIEISMIGSTREGSRAFYNDEVDTHLTLNDELKQFCFFDVKEQALKKRDPAPGTPEMPEEIAKYFDDKNVFKTEQFFFDFVDSVHSIISTLKGGYRKIFLFFHRSRWI